MKPGDSVHYIPYKGCDPSEYQNGVVKRKHDSDPDKVFVVYHCGGEWHRYMHYTGCLTNISDLREEWITKNDLRRVKAIIDIFGDKAFYAISLHDGYIQCQGYFNQDIVLKASKLNFNMRVNNNGHLEFTRNRYEIILTDNICRV